MRKLLKSTFSFLCTLLLITICLLTIQAGSGKVPYIFGFRILKVVTDSMRPAIQSGTCIIIEKTEREALQIGDIITFVSNDPSIRGFYNTHRIVGIIKDAQSGEPLYITKGDAAVSEDETPVSYEAVAGRYRWELPFGRLVYRGTELLMNSGVYFLLVILPLLLCLLSYLKQLWLAIFPGESQESGEEKEDGHET